MPDPRLPRGVFARLCAVAVIGAIALFPRLARAADDPSCATLPMVAQIAEAFGAPGLAPLDADKAAALRGFFAANALDAAPGDGAAMAARRDGSAIVYFLDSASGLACSPVRIDKAAVDAILGAPL